MCNWFKSKPKDLDGKIVPEYGIVIGGWDTNYAGIMELKPQWARIATDTGVNFNACVNMIRYFRARGVRVLLMCQDKTNQYNTPALCKRYAEVFRDDIYYEVLNEQNGGPDCFIKPEQYVNIFNEARLKIKTISANAKVVMGGLNGEGKKDTNDFILAVNYIRRFVNAGGMTDAWNTHHYSIGTNFYEIRDLIRRLDKNKEWIIGEYGTDNPNESVKIADYDFKMGKFTKNYVSNAIIYAWNGPPQWSINDKSQFKEYMKKNWRR